MVAEIRRVVDLPLSFIAVRRIGADEFPKLRDYAPTPAVYVRDPYVVKAGLRATRRRRTAKPASVDRTTTAVTVATAMPATAPQANVSGGPSPKGGRARASTISRIGSATAVTAANATNNRATVVSRLW
jgi:hypothetical protein